MALIKTGNFMGLPMNIQRGNPIPLDDTSVWYATGVTGSPADKTGKEKMEAYAASGATAYVGQILTYVTADTTEAYMISNAAGTLIKLASTTASGDLASDVATLQSQVAGLIEKVGVNTSGSETGLYKLIADLEAEVQTAQEAAEAAQTAADGKVASITAADSSITIGGTATAPTIKANLAEYSISKDETAQSGYAATYHLTKGGTNVGAAINIPKDMVVKSGEVVTDPDETHSGTYLVLTLANATEDKIYINVADLIEYVTSGSQTGDMVVVHIDDTTHKVTATITDGTITKAKLNAELQASLTKADSAVQSVELTTGTANGTVKLTVNGAVDAEDVAVAGLKDAAYATKTEIANIAIGTSTDTADTNTVYGVRKALTENNTSLTTEIGKKVDKITSLAGGKSGVYTDNGTSGMALTEVSKEAIANTIAQRHEDGKLTVAEPTEDTDAATKKYVDDNKVVNMSELTDDVGYLTKTNTRGNASISHDETGHVYISGAMVSISGGESNGGSIYLSSDGATIKNVITPTEDTDATNKKYVDDAVNTAVSSGVTVESTGTGSVVTSVTKTDGKITVTKGNVAAADVTGLSTELNKKVDTNTYTTDKETLESSIAAKQDDVGLTLASKDLSVDSTKVSTVTIGDAVTVNIAKLATPTADANAATKKYVDDTVKTATAGLSGAMHYIGVSTTDPLGTSGATVEGVTSFAKGDVVTYTQKEYVYDGTSWRELGDETSYAIKGSIKNADIADDAAISITKIDGLDTELASYLTKTEASETYQAKFNVINCGGAANL